MAFIPSPQQQAFFNAVERGDRSIILEAKAGAGKTSSIVKACERLRGKRVAALAFNTKIVNEIKDRVADQPHVTVMTCHSAGARTLRKAVPNLRSPDSDKMKKLATRFMQSEGRMDLETFVKAMCDTVSMAKQMGIGIGDLPNTKQVWRDMIDHYDLAENLPGMEEALEDEDTAWIEDRITKLIGWSMHMLKLSNQAVMEEGMHDFDDMLYAPIKLELRFFKNDVVFLDEAQDTNRTRRLIARAMLKPDGVLIAVGDRNQAIYGFSGADSDSLDLIAAETNAIRLPLSVTYRCPKEVVRVAQQWVPDLQAHESAPEGVYTEMPYGGLLDILQPGDAVLSRYNKYLVALCFKLIRNGKPARIEGRNIGTGLIALARKWKATNTDKLAENVVSWRDRECEKAQKEGKEQKAEQVADRAETLLTFIDRCAEEGIRTVKGLCDRISEFFADDVADKTNLIILCSVHRSKGLEFQRVFVLGLMELMGKEQKQEWQTQQEINLQYVAATRAMQMLCNVTGVVEDARQHRHG